MGWALQGRSVAVVLTVSADEDNKGFVSIEEEKAIHPITSSHTSATVYRFDVTLRKKGRKRQFGAFLWFPGVLEVFFFFLCYFHILYFK